MKTQKNYVLDLFRLLFTHFKKNKSFFWKTCFCHFSLCLDFYCWGFTAELQKKKMNRFRSRLLTGVQSGRRTKARTRIKSQDLSFSLSLCLCERPKKQRIKCVLHVSIPKLWIASFHITRNNYPIQPYIFLKYQLL